MKSDELITLHNFSSLFIPLHHFSSLFIFLFFNENKIVFEATTFLPEPFFHQHVLATECYIEPFENNTGWFGLLSIHVNMCNIMCVSNITCK
jgi:hypothetical protein